MIGLVSYTKQQMRDFCRNMLLCQEHHDICENQRKHRVLHFFRIFISYILTFEEQFGLQFLFGGFSFRIVFGFEQQSICSMLIIEVFAFAPCLIYPWTLQIIYSAFAPKVPLTHSRRLNGEIQTLLPCYPGMERKSQMHFLFLSWMILVSWTCKVGDQSNCHVFSSS